MTTKKKKPTLVAAPVKRQIKGSAKARRNSARLAAVQCLYQMRQNGMTAEQALGDYVNNRMGIEEDGTVYVAADTDLLRSIVTGAETHMPQLLEMLEQALDPSKPFDRQEQLIKATLLCAAEELFAHHDTDKALILSGYVEVAKAFYDGREPALVNAALDALAKVLRPSA